MSEKWYATIGNVVDISHMSHLEVTSNLLHIDSYLLLAQDNLGAEIKINGKSFPVGSGDYFLILDNYRIPVTKETAAAINEWIESGHKIVTMGGHLQCPECLLSAKSDWDYCPYDGTELVETEVEIYEYDGDGRLVKQIATAFIDQT